MSRRPNVIKTDSIEIALPEEQLGRIRLMLSGPDGKVPYGFFQKFFSARMTEYFEWERLDLQPFGFPAGMFVKGPRDSIMKMTEFLTNLTKES